MNELREMIISKLQTIKDRENGFDSNVQRWKKSKWNMFNGQHFSEVEFESLEDKDLLNFYDKIMGRCSIAM